MSPRDHEIWVRVRDKLMYNAINIYFDVGLSGQEVETEQDKRILEMWTRLTQKRVDVVLEFQYHWELVEIRHNATADAAGRLLIYKMLWDQERPDERPCTLTLVTDRDDKDLRDFTSKFNIKYIIA